MIVSQVIAAVRVAFSPKHIIFCVVEEVALNYYVTELKKPLLILLDSRYLRAAPTARCRNETD